MQIKPGTILANRVEMVKARKAANKAFGEFGYEMWVTSGSESTRTHGAGTLHWCNCAEDYDAAEHIPADIGKQIEKRVIEILGDARYDVIWHNGHLHVEYDPSEFLEWKRIN